MPSHGHMGVHEIAELLGVTRQRVHQLRAVYPDFPPPAADLKRGPIWHTRDIEAWLDRHPARPAGPHLPPL